MWIAVSLSLLVCVTVTVTALSRPSLRSRLPLLTCVGAAVSLAVTLAHAIGAVRPEPGAAALGMIESLALMTLTGLVTRYAPVRRAAAVVPVAGLAAAIWLLRFFAPASPLEGLGASAFWGSGVALAVGVGGYLRFLDGRQARAVADTRTALRLRLARDLHDFVAHDISEMLAHAQAGMVAGDPRQALERVEAAGQRAMSMLDRTLDMLHHDRPLTSTGGLGAVREAAERFSAAGPAPVRLRMDPWLEGQAAVPPETAALAYRVVVEGLTNVRRHAPRAGCVDLDVGARPGRLEITMTNDGVTRARGGRRGGSGLPGLTELVREQGGELVTSAARGTWSLTVRLPLAESPECPSASSSPTTRKASEAPSA
ncbi:histidine kinase [Spongiactinospora sp. TRM90649]|uniref:sensor histidine kinase n=1 Tax=Spongiactinospora sp. TRM90649 TaxID=3031114 RepID=UPI0023F6A099|nr:histidine kinase [Spongiactinospora sp. TRM90649]MDF5755060.1 histidine kinase [Spongiactinospora sp. TRM90649]